MPSDKVIVFTPTENVFCSICRTEYNEMQEKDTIQFIKTPCNHQFCNKCWCRVEEVSDSLRCPYCRHDISGCDFEIDFLSLQKFSDMERLVIWFNTHVPAELRSTQNAKILKQRLIKLITNGEKLNDLLCPPQGSLLNKSTHPCYNPIVIETYYRYMLKPTLKGIPSEWIPSCEQLQLNDAIVHIKLPDDTLCSLSGERIGYGMEYALCHNCNAPYLWGKGGSSNFIPQFDSTTNSYKNYLRFKCVQCKEIWYPIHRESTEFGQQYNKAYKDWKKMKKAVAEAKLSNTFTWYMQSSLQSAYDKFSEIDKSSRLNVRKNFENMVKFQGQNMMELLLTCDKISIYYNKLELRSAYEPFFLNSEDMPSRYGYAYTIPSTGINKFHTYNLNNEDEAYTALKEIGFSWFPVPNTINISTTETITFKPQYLAADARLWLGDEQVNGTIPGFYLLSNAVNRMKRIFDHNIMNVPLNNPSHTQATLLKLPHWVGNVNIDEFTAEGNWGKLMGPLMSSHCPSPSLTTPCVDLSLLSPNNRFLLYISQNNFQDFLIRPRNCNDCGCSSSNSVCYAIWDKEREWMAYVKSNWEKIDYIHPTCNGTNKLNVIKSLNTDDEGNDSFSIDFDILETVINDPASELNFETMYNNSIHNYDATRCKCKIELQKCLLAKAKTCEEKKLAQDEIDVHESILLRYNSSAII